MCSGALCPGDHQGHQLEENEKDILRIHALSGVNDKTMQLYSNDIKMKSVEITLSPYRINPLVYSHCSGQNCVETIICCTITQNDQRLKKKQTTISPKQI